MSLPLLNNNPNAPSGAAMPNPAKFRHEDGISLRLQVFVLAKDEQDRVALQRIQGYDGWCLSGESLLLNESPNEAAKRVVRSWYASPLEPKLSRVLSFPAMGGDDDRWYLVLLYEARAPADLKTTPDCLELKFHALSTPPGAWAMSHGDVWRAIGGK